MNEEELKAKIATLESEKSNLVLEITGDRKKNRDAIEAKDIELNTVKEALEKATKTNVVVPPATDVSTEVARQLKERDEAKAKDNRKAAFDKFVTENKDYHPDNDPGGLKRGALERELLGLTAWQSAVELDDLKTVIGKAETYLRGTDTSRQTNNPSGPSNGSSAVQPKEGEDQDITPQEKKLIERNNWEKDYYLKLKAKMPDFIENLVAQVR